MESHKLKQLSPSIGIIDPSQSGLIDENSPYPLKPFDEKTLEFLRALSSLLVKEKQFNRNPEIVSLSFWLRKANLLQIKKENQNLLENNLYSVHPLGIVFHVCPANVDTMFVYSICVSLLIGNKNIIRLSSRLTATVEFIVNCINELVQQKEYELFKGYIKIVTYDHSDEINRLFSEKADGRIIWGGDNTVNYFKNIKAKIRTKDIVFPNRISYALFKADNYFILSGEDKIKLAKSFFNDAYVFDQKGCSSPQMIYVMGKQKKKEAFLEDFYDKLKSYTTSLYKEETKGLSTFKLNALVNDVLTTEVVDVERESNSIYFVEIEKQGKLPIMNCGGGYFYVKHIDGLHEFASDMETRSQTLTYFGLSKKELGELDELLCGRGIDRIVPVGQALSFYYLWDGYNLIEELSRKRFIA